MQRLKRALYPAMGLIFWLLAATAAGQNISVSGVAIDSLTGEPLALVPVRVENSTTGVNTNLDGEFELFLPADTHVIYIATHGYKVFRDTIVVGENSPGRLELLVTPQGVSIGEVTISAKWVNPADRVMRNAIAHRRQNRFDKVDAYEYEAYNKLVITMDNVTDEFLDNKLLRNMGDVVRDVIGDSSTADSGKYKLAVFVSESISKFYFRRPDLKKEEILAVQTSGVQGTEYNLLNSMFLQIDIYDNKIVVLDKGFVSPLADGAFLDYRFQLTSTEINGRDTLYGVEILPKRPYDPVFQGVVYIDNKDWAVNRIDLWMNEDPNINYVEDIRIRQEYEKVDSQWVPVMLDLEVDFQNDLMQRKGGESVGLIGRSSSYLYNYKLEEPHDPKFYKQELIEIKADANDKDSTYWKEMRRSPLDKSELLGYQLVDSLTSRGVLDFYINVISFITWGTKDFKYFGIGPYFYLLGYNQAEGWRGRIGLYTNDEFSKRLYLGGHVAYGLRDKKLKYQGEATYRLRVRPKLEVGVRKTYEVEQVGFENFLNNGTSLLQTGLRRVPLTQLNYYDENKVHLYADILKGMSGTFYMRTKSFTPASTFPFAYRVGDNGYSSVYNITEAGANLRISFKEKYITQGGDRVYIRSQYPIFHVEYAKGFSSLLAGDYDYHSLKLSADNWFWTGRLGWMRYELNTGQVWGSLPYPSLHVFRGNQTWGYDRKGFNMMNYYEFVADRYATVLLEQHLEGLILNRIPLIRKLKWKEVITGRMAWGTLSQANADLNNISFPYEDAMYTQNIAAPVRPYYEAGLGIENILKIIRVDAIWRLNYQEALLDRQLYRNFGRRNNFGIRLDLKLSF